MNGIIDAGTRGYVHIVRRLPRWEIALLVTFAIGLWATYAIYRAVPSSFVPAEDEGYFSAPCSMG